MISITPYKELKQGEESIYDHVSKDFQVPDKVIAYLKTTKPAWVCMGVYPHPFREDVSLCGPYTYEDGIYIWDRDTWKYVVKYGLILPQEFVEYVMSGKGDKFLAEQEQKKDSWDKTVDRWEKEKGWKCFLPHNAGSISLNNF